MRQINVAVEDSVYEAAKIAAARAGMKFKKWVERALSEAAAIDGPRHSARTLDYTEGQ